MEPGHSRFVMNSSAVKEVSELAIHELVLDIEGLEEVIKGRKTVHIVGRDMINDPGKASDGMKFAVVVGNS